MTSFTCAYFIIVNAAMYKFDYFLHTEKAFLMSKYPVGIGFLDIRKRS